MAEWVPENLQPIRLRPQIGGVSRERWRKRKMQGYIVDCRRCWQLPRVTACSRWLGRRTAIAAPCIAGSNVIARSMTHSDCVMPHAVVVRVWLQSSRTGALHAFCTVIPELAVISPHTGQWRCSPHTFAHKVSSSVPTPSGGASVRRAFAGSGPDISITNALSMWVPKKGARPKAESRLLHRRCGVVHRLDAVAAVSAPSCHVG